MPTLSDLSVAPKKVTAGKQATVKLTLSEPALVTLAFTRRDAGRKGSGGKCVKPTHKNRKAKKCTRLVNAGSVKPDRQDRRQQRQDQQEAEGRDLRRDRDRGRRRRQQVAHAQRPLQRG